MSRTIDKISADLRRAEEDMYRLQDIRDEAFREYQRARSQAENAAATVLDFRTELGKEEARQEELNTLKARVAELEALQKRVIEMEQEGSDTR